MVRGEHVGHRLVGRVGAHLEARGIEVHHQLRLAAGLATRKRRIDDRQGMPRALGDVFRIGGIAGVADRPEVLVADHLGQLVPFVRPMQAGGDQHGPPFVAGHALSPGQRQPESGVEQPSFELWDDAPASKAKLIVIDECSMVDAELGRDLMSFGVPVLVLGDPASEFSALYRLVDVRIVRGVRVTIPAKPGFMKAVRSISKESPWWSNGSKPVAASCLNHL